MFDDGVIGTPEVQADFSEMQIFSDNCAVCAETSIINQFFPDLELDQESAAYISASNGWYVPGEGTSPDVVGNLMEHFGIETHTVSNATVEQLAMELQQGHGVVVGIRADELWESGPLAELKDALCEIYGLDNSTYQPANHAITVTGIDMSDPENPMVIINDSGVPDGAGASYPLDKFLDAWKNSDFQYVATNDPIPAMNAEGIGEEGFWGNFNWGQWIDSVADTGSGNLGAKWCPDYVLARGGIMAARTVVDFFKDDDIARRI